MIWLVLLATLETAFFPLLHDHAHDHARSAPQVMALVQEDAASAVSAPGGHEEDRSATPAATDTEACAVCAHFAGTCFSLLARFDAAFAAARAPPPVATVLWLRPLPVAWLLPASRAPPSLSLVTLPSAA